MDCTYITSLSYWPLRALYTVSRIHMLTKHLSLCAYWAFLCHTHAAVSKGGWVPLNSNCLPPPQVFQLHRQIASIGSFILHFVLYRSLQTNPYVWDHLATQGCDVKGSTERGFWQNDSYAAVFLRWQVVCRDFVSAAACTRAGAQGGTWQISHPEGSHKCCAASVPGPCSCCWCRTPAELWSRVWGRLCWRFSWSDSVMSSLQWNNCSYRIQPATLLLAVMKRSRIKSYSFLCTVALCILSKKKKKKKLWQTTQRNCPHVHSRSSFQCKYM